MIGASINEVSGGQGKRLLRARLCLCRSWPLKVSFLEDSARMHKPFFLDEYCRVNGYVVFGSNACPKSYARWNITTVILNRVA